MCTRARSRQQPGLLCCGGKRGHRFCVGDIDELRNHVVTIGGQGHCGGFQDRGLEISQHQAVSCSDPARTGQTHATDSSDHDHIRSHCSFNLRAGHGDRRRTAGPFSIPGPSQPECSLDCYYNLGTTFAHSLSISNWKGFNSQRRGDHFCGQGLSKIAM